MERRHAGLSFRIVRSEVHEHTDAPHAPGLLRPRGGRPRRRAAEQRDELAPSHSITSSAATSSLSGTARPSVFAVLRFMANSYLVGCWTGSSATFAPFRIRSAYDAARLSTSP